MSPIAQFFATWLAMCAVAALLLWLVWRLNRASEAEERHALGDDLWVTTRKAPRRAAVRDCLDD